MKLLKLLSVSALLGVLACGESPPVVELDLIETAGAPTLESLDRLNLVIQTGDVMTPLLDQDLGGNLSYEGELLPGTLFYVWVRGYRACTDTCVPPEQAAMGDCICTGKIGGAETEEVEGCTPWTCAETNRRIRVSLGTPTSLCPPTPMPAACPAL